MTRASAVNIAAAVRLMSLIITGIFFQKNRIYLQKLINKSKTPSFNGTSYLNNRSLGSDLFLQIAKDSDLEPQKQGLNALYSDLRTSYYHKKKQDLFLKMCY